MSGGRRLAHDWYDAPLPENVSIGDRSWVYSSFAFLHHRSERPVSVRIGHDTGIYRGTLFELGPDAEVEIGDHCTLAGPTVVTNGRDDADERQWRHDETQRREQEACDEDPTATFFCLHVPSCGFARPAIQSAKSRTLAVGN